VKAISRLLAVLDKALLPATLRQVLLAKADNMTTDLFSFKQMKKSKGEMEFSCRSLQPRHFVARKGRHSLRRTIFMKCLYFY